QRFLYSRIELKFNSPLQFVQKALCRPAMPQEKKFQPRPLAMLPQYIRIAKQFGNPLDGRQDLVPADKRVQSRSQVRFGGEPSRNSQGETYFGGSAQDASRRGQPNIVDLRIRAPHPAPGNRNLEFSGKVVEVAIPRQHSRCFQRQRRSITNFVRVHSRDRTAGDISCDIAASARRVQSHAPQRLEQFRKRLDRDPVQLNVLPYGDVGNSMSVAAGEVGNGSELFGTQQTVGNPDSHHEALQSPAFPTLSAGYARPIALRVHAPPAKVGPNPLWRNGLKPFTREAPYLLQTVPWILAALKALDPLCLGFCCCVCHSRHPGRFAPDHLPQKQKTHRQLDLAMGYKCRYSK